MLTENISMYVLLAYVEVLGKSCAESCGVEDRTGTDYLILGQSGVLAELIGENVNGIAYNYIDGVRSILYDLRDDRLGYVDVLLCKVDSRLTGLSRASRGEDHDVRSGGVAVASRIDLRGSAERNALLYVHGLSEGLCLVDVDHYDLGSDTRYREGVGDRRTDAACSDNADFVAHLL